MSIFNYYPYIKYNEQRATLILSKAEIITAYLSDYRKFFVYTIKNGERPDIIAYNEYDDSTLDWVIYLINTVFDPYKDWPLSEDQFKKYIENKYNYNAELLTTTLNDYSIAYYYYTGTGTDTAEEIAAYNFNITPETYNIYSTAQQAGWTAKSIWDYENEINEAKRNIILLRSVYIADFKQQFKDLFVNG